MRPIHNLTHRHFAAECSTVGRFVACGWRFLPRCELFFQPALPGAGWHKVPVGGVYEAMLRAQSPQEAMAILRAGP